VIRAVKLAACALILAATQSVADPIRIRMDYAQTSQWSDASSLNSSVGFPVLNAGSGGARFMWQGTAGDFRFDVASHVRVVTGDTLAYGAAVAPFYPAPVPATFFNLTQTLSQSGSVLVTNRIDRLSVSWSSPNMVLKLGRQAITWGAGLVFHPSDIVAPFSPNATDTAYKPGADMLYAQYLFDSGADIQAIVVPRGTGFGGPAVISASTYALRARAQLGPVETALMLAKDRGDNVYGLTLSGALGGASWNAEYVDWYLASGGRVPSWLVNITNFGTAFGKNISYFAEYYHNGFGVAATTPLAGLPARLTKRLSTGQVFLTGVDYLALGGSIQLGQDFSLAPNALINANDGSALASLSANYTLGDNSNLVFSVFQPFGADGTDFGGRETATGSGIFSGPGQSVSLQFVQFF